MSARYSPLAGRWSSRNWRVSLAIVMFCLRNSSFSACSVRGWARARARGRGSGRGRARARVLRLQGRHEILHAAQRRVRLYAKPLHVVELCDESHHLLLRALVTLLCRKARRLRARGVKVGVGVGIEKR